jgi:hypothetical protein
VYPGSGYVIQTQAIYLPVDSTTSGSIVHLNFQNLTYRTAEETYYSLYMGSAIKAQDMCLVNNIPHISFQDPGNTVLANDYSELADIKLTGDTDWVLNTLPVFISSFNGTISLCKLIVKSKGNKVTTTSSALEINGGSLTAQQL